jgi:16S rRNA (guanine527-N7)-methyltransferase
VSTEHTIPIIWLRNACLKNGILLSDKQIEQLEVYVQLLLDWNKKVNLISRKDESNIWRSHIFHAVSLLFKFRLPPSAHVIDLGTGGGLPGIPLKILQPDLQVTLIDATEKKIKVVQEITQKLSLNGVLPRWGRAEELAKDAMFYQSFDIAIARAVAPLKNLIEWSKPLLREKPGKPQVDSIGDKRRIEVSPPALLAMKGGDLTSEIEKIRYVKGIKEVQVIDLGNAGVNEEALYDKKVVYVMF